MTALQLKTTRKLLGLYLSECSRVTTFPASTINAMELGRTSIKITQAKTLRRRLRSETLKRIDQLTKLAGELAGELE